MKIFLRFVLVAAALSPQTACIRKYAFDDDDRQVITAVINNFCLQTTKGYLVLSNLTSKVSPSFTPESMDDTARLSLLARNKTSVMLPSVDGCNVLRPVSQEEIDSSLRGHSDGYDQWIAFYKKFNEANGIMKLSLPGYSADGTLAIVQVETVCGVTCGGSSFWVLRRNSNRWVLDKTIQGWAS